MINSSTESTRQDSGTIPGISVLAFRNQKKTRVSTNKVRTGCVTCKIRRIKCDEAKPACERCTKTGRTCDGYVDPPPRRKARTVTAAATSPGRSLDFMTGTTSELNALSHFYNYTAPKLSSNFDADFWSRLIFQMSHAEETIKYAMIAVGSLDARREHVARLATSGANGYTDNLSVHPHIEYSRSGLTVYRELTPNVSVCDEPFAILSYNRAVASVAKLIEDPGTSVEVVLLACVLFVYVEILRGNLELCLKHIKGGTCIAIAAVAGLQKNTSPAAARRVRQELLPIFNRLELLSMLFGTQPEWEYPVQIMQAVPEEFESLKDARDSVVHVMNSTYRFVRCIKFRKYEEFLLPDDLVRQTTIRTQNEAWRTTFERLLQSKEMDEKDTDIARILQLHYINGSIWLEIGVRRNETYADNMFSHFEQAVSIAEQMRTFAGTWQDRDTLRPNFLFDMEIISPLYLIGVKCRHPVIRRRAIAVLKKATRREGLWDSHMAAAVAERVMIMEEADLTVLDGSQLPPEEKRIHTLHVRSRSSVTHEVTFYSKPKGLDGPWRIWHEDVSLNRETIGNAIVHSFIDSRLASVDTVLERNHPHANRQIPPYNYYETNETLCKLLNEARVEQYGFDGLAMMTGLR